MVERHPLEDKQKETTMDATNPPDGEQSKLWNGTAGCAWVDAQAVTDRMFRALDDLLIEAVAARPGRVLDIGCGTGSTTVAIARRLGERGHATGIDISAPMLDAARERARRENTSATFLCADAGSHPFE